MTTTEFREYQEKTFDSFCKRVIRNESMDAHRELASRFKHEILLSALPVDVLSDLSSEDSYHPYCKAYDVLGRKVMVYSTALGEALQFLTPQQRNIILLYYFLEFNDLEIGKLLGISTRTIQSRRAATLRRLQKLLEESPYA